VASKVDCEVLGEVGDFGEYSNAVRVVRDGDDFLLDFCVYSNLEKRARLMSRIRVHQSFLSVIIERLAEELPGNAVTNSFLATEDDNLILFKPKDQDKN